MSTDYAEKPCDLATAIAAEHIAWADIPELMNQSHMVIRDAQTVVAAPLETSAEAKPR